jgi:hypothetical protein
MVFGLLLFATSACTAADPSSADSGSTTEVTTTGSAAPDTTPTGSAQVQTFTGEGDPPEDVRALLRPGDLDLLAWGRAAGEPWALVTWELIEEGKPTLTCTEVLPLRGEGYCAPPDGAGADGLFTPGAYVLGGGGLVVIHTAFGVDQVSVVLPTGSHTIKIHGEAGGYPPTGVLPTSGHQAEGILTALDANGNTVGEPRTFSFTESEFIETPLAA